MQNTNAPMNAQNQMDTESDSTTYTDYEFHFTSGNRVSVTVQEGRDTVRGDGRDWHIAINEGTTTRRLTVWGSKLDAVEYTQRVEKKDISKQFESTLAPYASFSNR